MNRRRRPKFQDDGWGEKGGYMKAKMDKLEAQSCAVQIESNIFKGISIYVNGYTNPTSEVLKKLITQNGGTYQYYYLKSRVTHIIATNLPKSKIIHLKDEKVVRPQWITDSIEMGKLIPYQNYLLYNQQSKLFASMKNMSDLNPSALVTTTQLNITSPSKIESNRSINSAGDESIRSDKHETFNDENANDETINGAKSVKLCKNISDGYGEIMDSGDDTGTNDVLNDLNECLFKDGKVDGDRLSLCDQIQNNITGASHSGYDVDNLHFSNSKSKELASTSSMSSTECLTTVPLLESKVPSNKCQPLNKVAEFYNKSRLHHISQWKFEAKAYVTQLQKSVLTSSTQCKHKFIGMEKLIKLKDTCRTADVDNVNSSNVQMYAHIDLDCFFVSVALIDKPELKGKPLAVTHSKADETNNLDGQGINSKSDIACCSYEARQAGVRNGMLFGHAKKLCKNLIALPYNFEAYKKISRMFYDVILSYTLHIEAVSCDELFVDLSELLKVTSMSPEDIMTHIRSDVFEHTKCTCSSGIGSNMLIARLATKRAKPNGQHFVACGNEEEFMKNIQVKDLPGVGYSFCSKLHSMNIQTCADIRKEGITLQQLKHVFGNKTGLKIFNQMRGIEERQIKPPIACFDDEDGESRKSVSAEINYGIRFDEMQQADRFIDDLSKEVSVRLLNLNRKGSHLTLKIKVRGAGAAKETYKYMGHGECDNMSKSSSLKMATNDADVFSRVCKNLLRTFKVPADDLRGIGIQISSLEMFSPHLQLDRPNSSKHTSSANNASTCNNTILKYATKMTTHAQTFYDDNMVHKVVDDDDDYNNHHHQNDDDGEFTLSLSQVDMDTMNELPLDIQLEIKQALENKKNQQQQQLNKDNNIGDTNNKDNNNISDNDSNNNNLCNKVCKTESNRIEGFKNVGKLGHQNLFQHDKKQQYHKQQPQQQHQQKHQQQHQQQQHLNPGCSFWNEFINENDDDFVTQQVKSNNEDGMMIDGSDDDEQKEANSNACQMNVDTSFLDAMPADIREELMNERTKQLLLLEQKSITKLQQQQQQQLQPFIKLMNLESPRKVTKPRRGRRRKYFEQNKHTSSKQLHQLQQNDDPLHQQQHYDTLKANNNINTNNYNACHDCITDTNRPDNVSNDNTNMHESEQLEMIADNARTTLKTHHYHYQDIPDKIRKCNSDQNNFSKFTNLQDIKNEIKSWINFSTAPNHYDLCHFTEYLMSLLESHDTRQVFLILKYIKRLDKIEPAWREQLNQVVSTIQAVIHSLFHGKLKLED